MHPADPTRASAIGPKGYGRFVEGLAATGSILTLLVAVLIAADVFARNLFNLPLMGVVELVAMFVVPRSSSIRWSPGSPGSGGWFSSSTISPAFACSW